MLIITLYEVIYLFIRLKKNFEILYISLIISQTNNGHGCTNLVRLDYKRFYLLKLLLLLWKLYVVCVLCVLFLAISCTRCGRHYKLKSSLLNHQRWECGKEPQFKCYMCSYKAKQKAHLLTHMKYRHKTDKINTEYFY